MYYFIDFILYCLNYFLKNIYLSIGKLFLKVFILSLATQLPSQVSEKNVTQRSKKTGEKIRILLDIFTRLKFTIPVDFIYNF